MPRSSRSARRRSSSRSRATAATASTGRLVDGRSVDQLTAVLASAAKGRSDSVVIISADALAAHQSVINVLDAARRAGLVKLTFAAQSQSGGAR